MSEVVFSFTECTPILQGPQLAVPAAVPEAGVTFSVRSTGRSAYRYVEAAGRRFRGWLTVTAGRVILNAVKEIRRVLSTAAARFNRNVLTRQGGLRL